MQLNILQNIQQNIHKSVLVSPGDAGIALVSNGNLHPDVTFTRTGSATYWDSDGLIRTAGTDVARRSFDPRFAGPGFLSEGASTNLLLHSNDFENVAWTKVGTWVFETANPLFSGQPAWKLTNPGDGGSRRLHQTVGVFTGSQETLSVVLEQGNADAVSILYQDVTNGDSVLFATYTFSTDTLTVEGTPTGTSPILERSILLESGPNGGKVVRFNSSVIPNSPGNTRRLNIYPTGTTVNTDHVYLHHAQHEERLGATSPIITTTAAASRSADSAVIDGAAFTDIWDNAVGTFVAESWTDAEGNADGITGIIGAGLRLDTNQRVNLTHRDTNSNRSVGDYINTVGGTGTDIDDLRDFGLLVKHAVRFKGLDQALVSDGVVRATRTDAQSTSFDFLAIGHFALGSVLSRHLNGGIRNLTYYPGVFYTDAELQAATS